MIIFDFDGVIADSFKENMRTINDLAGKYHHNKVDLTDLEKFRGLSSQELYLGAFGIAR